MSEARWYSIIPSCCLRYVRCCYQVKRISLTDYDSLRRCEVAKAWNDFQATLNTRRTFDSIDTTTCPQGWRASQNGVPIVGMQANRSQSLQWFQLQYLTVKFSKFIFVAFVLDFDIFFLDFSSWFFFLIWSQSPGCLTIFQVFQQFLFHDHAGHSCRRLLRSSSARGGWHCDR